MRIEDFNQIQAGYSYIYLSPHLDDAALSCGGAIAAQVGAGARPLVVTLCTAAPPPEGPFSALAQQFHADWNLTPDQAVAARLVEERLAMERLGCDYHWAGMLDAIYRYPTAYDRRDALFNAPAPDDPLFETLANFVGALRERFPDAAFYAPLGVGSHVDHLVTHGAIRATLGPAARFYEDLPYAVVPSAIDQRLGQLAGMVSATTIPIDATLAQKLHAIHAYVSQLKELFGGPEAMEQVMTDYAASLLPHGSRYGERIWRIDSA